MSLIIHILRSATGQKMRGSIAYQAQQIFLKSGINKIGESKHQAKESARADGARTWHEVGKKLGVHSYATADAYRDVWRSLLKETRNTFNVKNIEKLSKEHVQNFLMLKSNSVAMATFNQYAAACEKLETALNMYARQQGTAREYNFSISSMRKGVSGLRKFEGTRAYDNPKILINSIDNPVFKLAASIQHEGGARIKEADLINPTQLRGLVNNNGKIHIDKRGAKGGKPRDIFVSKDSYQQLCEIVSKNGVFDIGSKDKYRQSLKIAAEKTGQKYTGSHGLRWNFAQNRMDYHMTHGGLTYEAGLVAVSDEMGHVRGDITEHYLENF